MQENNRKYRIAGLMSGTSVDGLDIACCEFEQERGVWKINILAARTVAYSKEWKERLSNAHCLSAENLAATDIEYGTFCGNEVNRMLKETDFRPQAIASHGHTVFHQPERHFTLQIGNGAAISAVTGLTTICDFRAQDVALGGQGAPLVPAGDELLFPEYEICLNIGGFSNLSTKTCGSRTAWDICPANIILNRLAKRLGADLDRDGKIAASGKLIPSLFEKLNHIDHYHQKPPKSLGREWLENSFIPHLETYDTTSVSDLIRTITEHIAFQISCTANQICNEGRMLVSGGGALNVFLMELIRSRTKCQVVVADEKILHFKEAMIFAFLGLLRSTGVPNCLASVTGAAYDHCSGAVYEGKEKNIRT
jgi:anhydro-N-acetylmuramic acid kinase